MAARKNSTRRRAKQISPKRKPRSSHKTASRFALKKTTKTRARTTSKKSAGFSLNKLNTQQKLLVGVVGLAIALFAVLSFSDIQVAPGQAIASVIANVATPVPINAWGYEGWGDCSSQDGDFNVVNNYCLSKGYANGAVPNNPCLHERKAQRYRPIGGLDGWSQTTTTNNLGLTNAGLAVTQVKCENKPGEIDTPVPITAEGYEGWGDCSSQDGTLKVVNSYCISKGYTKGVASGNVCLHSQSNQRYNAIKGKKGWVKTTITNNKGTSGAGIAVIKVRCEI